jgi:hypothetical protein
MEIRPQDLGIEAYLRILYGRMAAQRPTGAPVGGDDTPVEKRTWLDRFSLSGLSLTREQFTAAIRAGRPSARILSGMCWAIGGCVAFAFFAQSIDPGPALIPDLLAGLTAAGTAYGGLAFRRFFFRNLHRPLNPAELEILAGRATNELEREYLRLIEQAIRQAVPPAAEEGVRATLAALGAALSQLPTVEMPAADPAELRQEANGLRARAAGESDRITAESLERHARAMLQRAETYERTALMARRSEVLRAELAEQMTAFRAVLASLGSAAGNPSGLAELASAASHLAAQTGETAAARAELESVLGRWPATNSVRDAAATGQLEDARLHRQ